MAEMEAESMMQILWQCNPPQVGVGAHRKVLLCDVCDATAPPLKLKILLKTSVVPYITAEGESKG